MIDHAHDLAVVFFGPDFAQLFRRVRAGAPDVELRFLIGAVDDTALEERTIAVTRVARFPSSWDVRADDKLVALEGSPDVPAGAVLKVLDHPRRVIDGLEKEALLGSASA